MKKTLVAASFVAAIAAPLSANQAQLDMMIQQMMMPQELREDNSDLRTQYSRMISCIQDVKGGYLKATGATKSYTYGCMARFDGFSRTVGMSRGQYAVSHTNASGERGTITIRGDASILMREIVAAIDPSISTGYEDAMVLAALVYGPDRAVAVVREILSRVDRSSPTQIASEMILHAIDTKNNDALYSLHLFANDRQGFVAMLKTKPWLPAFADSIGVKAAAPAAQQRRQPVIDCDEEWHESCRTR